MNQIVLLGRVTKDYDLRKVGDKNTENCSFTLAVDREYKSADGNRQADFLSVVCWGQLATFAHKFFQKGARMLMTGSAQSRSYDGSDGKKVYVTEFVAKSIEFIDLKKDNLHDGVPASSGAKMNGYLPEEVKAAESFYPALDDDTFGELPFNL